MTEVKNTSDEKNETDTKVRSFRAIFRDPTDRVVMGGRYIGNKPGQAASKALTKIYRMFKKANVPLTSVRFGIYETTRHQTKHRTNNTRWYKGERVKLDTQVVIKNVDKKTNQETERVCNYKNKYYKIKNSEDCSDLFKYHVMNDKTNQENDIVEKLKKKKNNNKKLAKQKKTDATAPKKATKTKKEATKKEATAPKKAKKTTKTQEPVKASKQKAVVPPVETKVAKASKKQVVPEAKVSKQKPVDTPVVPAKVSKQKPVATPAPVATTPVKVAKGSKQKPAEVAAPVETKKSKKTTA
jgi:hypothetical protein